MTGAVGCTPLALATCVVDGVWNVCLTYMVLRFTDADSAPVIHVYSASTHLIAPALLVMAMMKWGVSLAVTRSRSV